MPTNRPPDPAAPRCAGYVTPSGQWGAFHTHPCRSPGKVERENVWYCGKHDPQRPKTKNQLLTEANDHIRQMRWALESVQRDALQAFLQAHPLDRRTLLVREAEAALEAAQAHARALSTPTTQTDR